MAALSEEDRQKALAILEQTRALIDAAAAADPELRFGLRRYILKRLEFDERGTPTQRRKLKDLKRRFQRGLCFECAQPLPATGAELHRLRAIDGYTEANTRLLCRSCHARAQQADVCLDPAASPHPRQGPESGPDSAPGPEPGPEHASAPEPGHDSGHEQDAASTLQSRDVRDVRN